MHEFKKFEEIILEAGDLLKEGFFQSEKKIDLKGKKDLVTQFDVKVEAFLKEAFSSFGFDFIAEESESGFKTPYNTIIIDPIDGTTNFAHKIPHCAISVAIYKKGILTYGFVYNPILNEFFYAIKDEGAFLNAKKIEVSKNSYFQRALIATGFPYSSADNIKDLEWVMEKLKNILPKCQDIRRLGSAALDLCYVACGRYEGFYEINLKPWDVAAGSFILQEAGGRVSNDRGDEFDMFKDKCIVASNKVIHEEFIKTLNKK